MENCIDIDTSKQKRELITTITQSERIWVGRNKVFDSLV
jgi:hypothetical protein